MLNLFSQVKLCAVLDMCSALHGRLLYTNVLECLPLRGDDNWASTSTLDVCNPLMAEIEVDLRTNTMALGVEKER